MTKRRVTAIGACAVVLVGAVAAVRMQALPSPAVPGQSATAPPSELGDAPVPAWVHLGLSQPNPETLSGLDIWAGSIDDDGPWHIEVQFERAVSPSSVMTRALPFISQPRDGRFTYGYFDGTRSELHLFDIASGEDRTLGSGPTIYHSADQDASGLVYAILLDPITRAELGIFQIREGTEPRQIVPPRQLPFAALQGSLLRVTPSGERLITTDCTFSGCTMRVYDARLGTEIGKLAIGNSGIVGLTDTIVGLSEPCSFQCPQQMVDIGAFVSDPIALACGPAVLAILDLRPVIVSGSEGDCTAPGHRLIAQWPSGGRRDVGSAGSAGLQLVQPTGFDGFELPPGMVFLSVDGTIGTDGPVAILNLGTRRAEMIN